MPTQNSHILIIEDDKGRREFTLTEPVYSMGRDAKCDIRIFSVFLSRRQATLFRKVRDDGSYFYHIVDGDGKGQLSPCGFMVNGRKYQSYDLKDEDEIFFNPSASAKYYIMQARIPGKSNINKTQPTVSAKPPKLGGLYAKSSDGKSRLFPLQHTEVQAWVIGNVSRVEVRQTFKNPFTIALEATYIFPLPDEAAVDDMEIRIGDRIIKGSIKKRIEAQQMYEQAKKQGRTAGLLEQERDNIFTQSLANIKPGEQIDVIIRYTDSLKFEGGNYEFVFPMVVGPRYIPGTTIDDGTIGSGSAPAPMTLNRDTDVVPDASRLNAPILPPATRSGHDINVTVEINAGVEIKEIDSPSHQIQIERQKQIVHVKLAQRDTIPNKDLIVRYRVAGDRTQTTVLSQADLRGGHFAVYLIPAMEYRPEQLVPKDMVFLIDTSGSQQGDPLLKCQELMRRFINGLNPYDTFNIMDFSDSTRQLSPVPLANTVQNRHHAMNYINRLNAGGGTQMLRGIRAVLNLPEIERGRLRSIVLLTDGYIGNENQILAEIQRHLKPGYRFHSFGAGSSVNRFLLNRIAEIGRGISRMIRHDQPTEQVAEEFFKQINNPVLTTIQLTWQGSGEPPSIYPTTPPDLFAEQPLVLFGRTCDFRPGRLHITGTVAGGERYQQTFDFNFEELIKFEDIGNPTIAQLWGRARIKDLMNQMLKGETKGGVDAVTETALAYQLLSQYTAFVAVSDEVRVKPWEHSVSVQVPVEMPEGVSYEGIFGDVTQRAAPEVADEFDDLEALLSEPRDEFDITLIDPGMMGADEESFADEEGLADVEYSPPPSMAPSARQTPPADPDELVDIDAELEFLRQTLSQDHRLQIVSATGLNEEAIALLTQRLQSIQLPPGVSGDVVFEFYISKGRVQQVVIDEPASSLHLEVTAAIRRSLLTWRLPQAVVAQVRLLVRILP